jgi:hypothetical protein
MDWSGWVWMTSSELGMYFHFGNVLSFGFKSGIGLVLHGFLQYKKYILVDITYIHPSKPFPGLRGGGNGWMAVDTFG